MVLRTDPAGTDDSPVWAKDPWECELALDVSADQGLSSTEAQRRRDENGWNELDRRPGPSLFALLLSQFDHALVRLLLAAAAVSFALAWYDRRADGQLGPAAFMEPLVISLILILNASIGVWHERSAQSALQELRDARQEVVSVWRDGALVADLPDWELVPGDVVRLRVGDKVPADMRVLRLLSSTLRVDQGSVTGEIFPANKSHGKVEPDVDIRGKECMLFAGTTVVGGSCVGLVVATGMRTEVGKVHAQIRDAAEDVGSTNLLKVQLGELGVAIIATVGVICAIVWLVNARHFFTWENPGNGGGGGWRPPTNLKFHADKCAHYFKLSVSLAVAAIPEGLPAVITACLALGTRKLARKKVLVRNLPAVEALGCVTVICSDQTGTLTTDHMSAAKVVVMGSAAGEIRSYSVSGTTYDPRDGRIDDRVSGERDASLEMIAKVCAVCNDATIARSGDRCIANGIPTEAALTVLVEKIGLPVGAGHNSVGNDDILACGRWWNDNARRIATLEFDWTRMSMGVIARPKSGPNMLLVKGAVENVLERSSYLQVSGGSIIPFDEKSKMLLLEELSEMSTNGLRCLGFAFKNDLSDFAHYDGENHPSHKILLDSSNYPSIESDLVFLGIAGLRDPPREEVCKAIEDCRGAGIRVIVLTGDFKSTAESICRETGVFGPDEDISLKSFTGKEFMELPNKKSCLHQVSGLLLSRVTPTHKQEIVKLLREEGEVVAMMGDGVNDALALKLADIGIAMGIAGAEVTKEASDLVLVDDNFSTLVASFEEGRSIYNNMMGFIRYIISSNIGEVASILFAVVLGIPEGLMPIQLLWVNLVTDGPPATALGFNRPTSDVMKKPPRRRDNPFTSAWVLFRYLVIGLYIGTATAGICIIWYTQDSFLGIDLSKDGHSLVTYSQLTNWGQCSAWQGFNVSSFTAGNQVFSFDNPCDYFTSGKVKATTLSLSVLVAIEMFNSLNALSEDRSLLTVPPWVNPWLLLAMLVSFSLHSLILYVPFLKRIFGTVSLSLNELLLVLVVAFPVILIDEVLKLTGRYKTCLITRTTTKRAKSA